MFNIKSRLSSLGKKALKYKPKRKPKQKEMLSNCIDEFAGGKKTNRRRYSKALLDNMTLNIKEDTSSYLYIFTMPKLKKTAINVSYKDDYLTIERTQREQEARFFTGMYEKNSIKRVSSKSYYLAGIDEAKIDYKISGNKLSVYLPKK